MHISLSLCVCFGWKCMSSPPGLLSVQLNSCFFQRDDLKARFTVKLPTIPFRPHFVWLMTEADQKFLLFFISSFLYDPLHTHHHHPICSHTPRQQPHTYFHLFPFLLPKSLPVLHLFQTVTHLLFPSLCISLIGQSMLGKLWSLLKHYSNWLQPPHILKGRVIDPFLHSKTTLPEINYLTQIFPYNLMWNWVLRQKMSSVQSHS